VPRGADPALLPPKPTVIVYRKPGSRQDFGRIEAAIAAVLHSERYPEIALHLELMPGMVVLA